MRAVLIRVDIKFPLGNCSEGNEHLGLKSSHLITIADLEVVKDVIIPLSSRILRSSPLHTIDNDPILDGKEHCIEASGVDPILHYINVVVDDWNSCIVVEDTIMHDYFSSSLTQGNKLLAPTVTYFGQMRGLQPKHRHVWKLLLLKFVLAVESDVLLEDRIGISGVL